MKTRRKRKSMKLNLIIISLNLKAINTDSRNIKDTINRWTVSLSLFSNSFSSNVPITYSSICP